MAETLPRVPDSALSAAALPAPVIIVGGGPVAMHFLRQLRRDDQRLPVKLFSRERWLPYDRVGLSAFLAGDVTIDSLETPLEDITDNRTEVFIGRGVGLIDRAAKLVMDDLGHWHSYSHLLIATGSLPHVPKLPGTDLAGVFRFRDMNDAQGLMARRVRSRHTVVVGGGLLGIEAARAMCCLATRVTLIQHSDRLMNRQLDGEAAGRVQQRLEAAGVSVQLNRRLRSIHGQERVSGIQLDGGEMLPCDTVVFATGIAPNTQLARDSGLAVADGIRIDEQARTSDPAIFAAGECAQFGDELFGLVAPGLEQAAVAAANIRGQRARYLGSIGATRLKVLDLPCFSAGRVDDAWQYRIDRSPTWQGDGQYRRLFIRRGRLVGAIGVGQWPEQARLQTAIKQQEMIWPWQLLRFRRNGCLWPDAGDVAVAAWPPTAMVCQCRQVSRGDLEAARVAGAADVTALSQCTGAGTVCGSCKPLLENLCGNATPAQRSRREKAVMPLSLACLALLALAWMLPFSEVAASVSEFSLRERIWRNGLAQQISGYTLLGLSVFAALLGLRKRWTRFSLGAFASWRLAHLIIGLLLVAALYAHTGFRLGQGVNAALMSSYLALLLVGGLAGLVALRRAPANGWLSRAGLWGHILALWPLPALLCIHILMAYVF